jgi:hypothetical protein
MRRTRAAVALTVGAIALVCSGCYGSTEKASDVGLDSVKLNGQFTANNGPAESWFEYWPTSTPANRILTQPRSWAAGATGPTSDPVDSLQQGTQYSFRLCGRDQGGPSLCAQTRTFVTQSPDTVSGNGTGVGATNEPLQATLSASSGPSGENPTGTLEILALVNGNVQSFSGNVVCLNVGSAGVAIFAANGRIQPGLSDFTVFGRVVTSSTPGQDTMDFRAAPQEPNPTCGAHLISDLHVTGDFTITDSQPPPPPT